MRPLRSVAVLPTLITLGNGFCGFLAISKIADAIAAVPVLGHVDTAKLLVAGYLIFLAMVFDAFDGFVARLTKSASDFGGQLDSLCDAVSFGLAPAFLAKVMIEHGGEGIRDIHPKLALLLTVPFVLCAILRLARFNVQLEHEDEAHDAFQGLPTPAAAGAVAAIALLFCDAEVSRLLPFSPNYLIYTLLPLAPLLAFLMVSKLHYVHFVSKLTRGRRSLQHLVGIIGMVVVFAFYPELFLAVGLAVYVASGPLVQILEKASGRRLVQRAPEDFELSPEEEALLDLEPEGWEVVYVGLGSNVGNRANHLRRALEMLEQDSDIRVRSVSDLLETKPLGGPPQRNFLNAVVAIETTLAPGALLDRTQEIEALLGRRRLVRWGPRTVDLDILLFGDRVIDTARLVVPHPRITERGFVLEPLSEMAGETVHPVLGQTIRELYDEARERGAVDESLRRIQRDLTKARRRSRGNEGPTSSGSQ
ncbi:MAG: 2-amino-4-hydroxy-6-hydroxymethyldihydropteridine diphosphokinase [Planctomycetota bacterium]